MPIFNSMSFDKFNQQDKLYTVLCNPNKSELYSLGTMFDTKVTLKYNALSELSFSYKKTVDGVVQLAYDLLKTKRLVLIEKVGYFIITDVQEDTNGLDPKKTVTCNSLEAELNNKKVSAFKGTIKFYDILTPTGTFIQKILETTGWGIGQIDPELYNIYRTFDVSDGTIYSVLMSDAETAYGCIFEFDTFAKTVSATKISNATTKTDIYLSYNNLIKKSTLNENSDEIVTALAVFGGGNLDIRSVNPIGTDYIYDFSYYKKLEWMSQGLIDALTLWENNYNYFQPGYNTQLATLKQLNLNLITQTSELSFLYTENTGVLATTGMDALVAVQKSRIEAGLPYSDVMGYIAIRQGLIDAKTVEIRTTQQTITSVKAGIAQVNNLLSFNNPINFTSAQLLELRPYIIENTYQNSNIIITDIMTPVETQDAAQELFDFSQTVLTKIASPRYEFSMDTTNFIALPEYQQFTDTVDLGSIITIEIDEDYIIENVVLQIQFSLDKPSDFSMIFGNRLRLDGQDFIFSDLFGQTVKASTSVKFSESDWGNWENTYKNDVTNFINSSLNTANNQLINSSNQEIVINKSGLHGLQLTSADGVEPKVYSPKQMWLTGNMLAFSDDSFAHSRLALGNIIYRGQSLYGLVSDVLIGNIVAGTQLSISNAGNNFTLDENGAVLSNATFSIQNSLNRIFLDPTNGIKLQKNENAGLSVLFSNLTTKTISGATSATFSYTVSSNSNRLLVLTSGSNNGTILTAKYGTQNFIKKTSIINSSSGAVSEIWYLVAPLSGAHNIVVTFSGSNYSELCAREYYNVNQTTPLGTSLSVSGNGSSATLSPQSLPKEVVIDTICFWNTNSTVFSGQTQRYNVTSDGSWNGSGSDKPGASGAVSVGWNFSSSANYAYTAVSIKTLQSTATWTDKFYLDANGDIVMSGSLSAVGGTFTGALVGATGTFSGALQAATGTFTGTLSSPSGVFGGWQINTTGISDNHGNYINSDGNVKLGALTIDGGNATFDGTINATRLVGQIVNSQIGDGQVSNSKISNLSADKITVGTLNGININWPGVRMYSDANGYSRIHGDTNVDIGTNTSSIYLGTNTITIETSIVNGYVDIGGDTISFINCNNIRTHGNNYGISGSFVAGARTLYFNKGILYNVT